MGAAPGAPFGARRYLVFNLHALNHIRAALGPQTARGADFAGNTDAAAGPERMARSIAAIDAFFRDLPAHAGLPPDRTVFLLDGARHATEVESIDRSYFGHMRRAFAARAIARGYQVIDLQPHFLERSRDGTRLDFEIDGHWNAKAHAVIAHTLAEWVNQHLSE